MAVTFPNGLVRILDVVAATVSPVFAIDSDVDSMLSNTRVRPGSAWMTVLFTVRITSDVWSISGDILFSKDSSLFDSLISASVIMAITLMLMKEPAMYQMTRMFVAVAFRFMEMTV